MEFGHVEAHQLNNEPYDIENINEAEAEQCRDKVTIFIEEKLQQLPPMAAECSIYRVPKRLLDMNRKAYVPQVISIGPFYHGQQVFMATEELKLRFFNSYRCRTEMSVEGIVKNAWSWEKRARNYYAELINMNNDDFVKMMLLDGCFMVEFLIMDCGKFPETEKKVHSSFYEAMNTDIHRDLTMLENQLPFFVLQGLFDLISEKKVPFEQLVHEFLNNHVLTSPCELPYNRPAKKPKHLVDFLSSYYVPLPRNENCAKKSKCLPPSVTELCEAGVVLKATEKKNIMNINFKDGILEIPSFEIDDGFETYVRNLMAFEQFPSENNTNYATHYVVFLDDLITTEKDVRLLVKEKIITNSVGGSDEEISNLFNDLCKNITVDIYNYFGITSEKLQKHCQKRRNRWMASLKHNYFNTPWAFISFLAASFLILLTLLQTIFSAK